MTHPALSSTSVLAASIVEKGLATNRQNLYVLHGIYGRGRNWAGLTRMLAATRSDWRSVLVDLRGHGESPAVGPPHTVDEAALDVARLGGVLELTVDAVLGHSFGGKVALACAASAPRDLAQVWVVDSTPAAKVPDGSAWRLLEVVRRHSGPFESRQAAIDAIRGEGFDAAVAAWMVSNLEGRNGAYAWRLDFDLMEALLQDFFRQDLWHVIDAPPPGLHVHIVKATESTLLTEDACARVDDAARRTGRVTLHRVQGGHWLHTDNPNGVAALLQRHLPRLRT